MYFNSTFFVDELFAFCALPSSSFKLSTLWLTVEFQIFLIFLIFSSFKTFSPGSVDTTTSNIFRISSTKNGAERPSAFNTLVGSSEASAKQSSTAYPQKKQCSSLSKKIRSPVNVDMTRFNIIGNCCTKNDGERLSSFKTFIGRFGVSEILSSTLFTRWNSSALFPEKQIFGHRAQPCLWPDGLVLNLWTHGGRNDARKKSLPCRYAAKKLHIWGRGKHTSAMNFQYHTCLQICRHGRELQLPFLVWVVHRNCFVLHLLRRKFSRTALVTSTHKAARSLPYL